MGSGTQGAELVLVVPRAVEGPTVRRQPSSSAQESSSALPRPRYREPRDPDKQSSPVGWFGERPNPPAPQHNDAEVGGGTNLTEENIPLHMT